MPASISLGDTLRVLTDEKRRAVVAALRDSNPRKVENVIPTEDAVRVEMFHRHFPLMETHDVIAWNADDDVIARGPNFDAVDEVLRRVADVEPAGRSMTVSATSD